MALLEGAGLSDQADAAVAEVDAEQGFDNDVMPEGEPWGGNGTRSIDTPVEDARLYESSLHEVADAAVERTWQDESSTHDMAGRCCSLLSCVVTLLSCVQRVGL
jgi:hypothetical protein